MYIKNLQGDETIIEIDNSLPMLELKKISGELNKPIDLLFLYYEGTILHNDKHITDYSIESGSNIHVVVRLQGGH